MISIFLQKDHFPYILAGGDPTALRQNESWIGSELEVVHYNFPDRPKHAGREAKSL
jgi:hypothetical protein